MSLPPPTSLALLPTRLGPSRWWLQAPLAGVLIERCRPATVALLGCDRDEPAQHLRELLLHLSPQTTLLDVPRPARTGPPPQGLDLLLVVDPVREAVEVWIECLKAGSILLLAEAPEDVQSVGERLVQALPDLPGLWIPRGDDPSWRAEVQELLPLLRRQGERLAELASSAGPSHAREVLSPPEDQALRRQLEDTVLKLETLENSTIWRASAPLRLLLDAPKRSGMLRLTRRMQSRLTRRPASGNRLTCRRGAQRFDPRRSTVLLLSHETSATGAPILAWNLCRRLRDSHNVVLLSLRAGDLDGDLLQHCVLLFDRPLLLPPTADLVDELLSRLPAGVRPGYALVNTIQCWQWLEWLRRRQIPSVLLVHEFGAYVRPFDAFRVAFLWAAEVVFSSTATWDDVRDRYPDLSRRVVRILPQGSCSLPPSLAGGEDASGPWHGLPALRALHGEAWLRDCLLVLGAGAIQPRKGVDLFVETAHQLRVLHPGLPLLFLWLGSGYDPEEDFAASIWIEDQIRRSDLTGCVQVIEASEAYGSLMRRADLFLLTSRLDPLPNVAIDALQLGTPVLCFERASGTATWLAEDPLLREHCLARYLDPSHLAHQASRLLDDSDLRIRLGRTGQDLAARDFDMSRYLAELQACGAAAVRSGHQERRDQALLRDGGWLQEDFFLSPEIDPGEDATLPYLMGWSHRVHPRKPRAGFNPGVYAEHTSTGAEDPYAHFLRAGQPAGPWSSPVIRPESAASAAPDMQPGLHVHVYYPELLEEILELLAHNRLRPHLVLSLARPEGRAEVERLLKRHGHGDAEVLLTPNRGRDLGPLLVEVGRRLEADFPFHGHVHTKKSELIDSDFADRWRSFLLTNLLGDAGRPMLDAIALAMAADPGLGLVYPDDPNVLGWGRNRREAATLCQRLGIAPPSTEVIDFPIGTMFWARRGALTPLYEQQWSYEDLPEEPLGYDGTLLHAVERLLPEICRQSGFHHAVTHVPGVTR